MRPRPPVQACCDALGESIGVDVTSICGNADVLLRRYQLEGFSKTIDLKPVEALCLQRQVNLLGLNNHGSTEPIEFLTLFQKPRFNCFALFRREVF